MRAGISVKMADSDENQMIEDIRLETNVKINGSPEMEVAMAMEVAIYHREEGSQTVAGSLARLHQLPPFSVIDKMTGESKVMTQI